MTAIRKSFQSHRALITESMLPYKAMISGGITYRPAHDDKWREFRKSKALSWPKSFTTSVSNAETASNSDCQDSTQKSLSEDGKQIDDCDKAFVTKQVILGHSMGSLSEEHEDLQNSGEDSISRRFSRFAEASLHSNINSKRWSIDEELNIQPGNKEKSNTDKNVGPRRVKGGLRDLIRLHEEEIARASGTSQAYAKRPKHEALLQLSNPYSFDENLGQTVSDSKDDANTGKVLVLSTEKGQNQSRTSPAEVTLAKIDANERLPKERGLLQQDQFELLDKSTETDDVDNGLPSELELELKRQILEKESLINSLLKDKEDLLGKLEEQKKVANAYQKLEDRYRRKVFELEKVLLACNCGGLESKSFSDQDLSKHLSHRYFHLYFIALYYFEIHSTALHAITLHFMT